MEADGTHPQGKRPEVTNPPSIKDISSVGTGHAQTEIAMKAMKFSEQFADGGEQNLPKPQIALVESAGIPPATLSAAPTGTLAAPPVVETPSQLLADWNRIQQSGSTAQATPPVSIPGNAQADRIAHLVATEAALMVSHRADSLAVVIRPDAQTELFLQLRQHNGQIEAFVRCERGDITSLGAGWGELQERLARQDIRLSPLQTPIQTRDDLSVPPGKGDTAHDRSDRKRHDIPASEELPMVGSITEPLRRPARSRARKVNGWESWA